MPENKGALSLMSLAMPFKEVQELVFSLGLGAVRHPSYRLGSEVRYLRPDYLYCPHKETHP